MKKTVIAKVIFAAILVLLTLTFVTCEDLLTNIIPKDDGEDGYTDVVYETVGTGNDLRIKSVTLYLDGEKVPRTAESRKLDLEAARMGHDFFEVVFWVAGGVVARTSWEIGQQAGIAGVTRGQDYGPHAPPDSGTAASAIFVGKKSSKTLLGVGYLSLIDDNPGTEIIVGTTSVTFTVSPLKTWLGFTKPATGDPLVIEEGGVATFVTSASAPALTATPGRTLGSQKELRVGAEYPQFDLPTVRGTGNVPPDTGRTVNAIYTIGGLNITGHDLRTAVRTWGRINGTLSITDTYRQTNHVTGDGAAGVAAANARGGLQFIKRTPAFLYQGTTYGLPNNDDKVTGVALAAPTPSDGAFVEAMNITITQYPRSGGVFAITFQQPVYLLTIMTSNNPGGTGVKAEKWFVRPDYGVYQYMLDNGQDSGGAVLLATDLVAGSGDWIEIKTTGIGFDNE